MIYLETIKSELALEMSIDLHGSSRTSEVAVCLIPATYLGMHSPVLGPAVLHRDTEVAVGPDSEVWPLIHV